MLQFTYRLVRFKKKSFSIIFSCVWNYYYKYSSKIIIRQHFLQITLSTNFYSAFSVYIWKIICQYLTILHYVQWSVCFYTSITFFCAFFILSFCIITKFSFCVWRWKEIVGDLYIIIIIQPFALWCISKMEKRL